MQQKEVLIIASVLLVGILLISQENIFSAEITGQESNTITGAVAGRCNCPYATGDEFLDSDFQLEDGTWLWNWLGVLWSDSSPRYVALATGCLPRTKSSECWTQTCLVILGDVFGNNERRNYRCGWPPPPSDY